MGRGSAVLKELQAMQDQGFNFALGYQRWRRVGPIRRARALEALGMLNIRELANLKLAQVGFNINNFSEPAFMADVLRQAECGTLRETRSLRCGSPIRPHIFWTVLL